MRSVRAIAAAMVAVCISFGGKSLLAQAIQGNVSRADEEATPSFEVLAESLQSSIGLRAGDPGFNTATDLNNDGMVNAVDVALWRLGRERGNVPAMSGNDSTGNTGTITASTERVIVEGQTTFALPGTTVSILFLIRDNTTPILSYTIETNTVAQTGATGSVTANVAMTNFFDIRNLITSGGAMRDPFFSTIEDNGSGVSVTTITSDLSTVQAVDNVNDVLAQVFFDVPQEALGDFSIELASGSVLVDGNAATVPFAFTPGTIHVMNPIPAVSVWGMIVLGHLVVTAGSVVFKKRARIGT